MVDVIEQSIKTQDKFMVEMKLDYELHEGRRTRYQIATYIFIPPNLGINPATYDKERFYRNIQNYIRLKTPTLILREFTRNKTRSPFFSIEECLTSENWALNRSLREKLTHNLKYLGAMLRSALREHLELIRKRIQESPSQNDAFALIHNLIEEFLIETERISERYQSYYSAFNLPNVDSKLFSAYEFIDESISILIEEAALELFQEVTPILKKRDSYQIKNRIGKLIAKQAEYRRSRAYPSIVKLGDNNEEYSYRASVLKKYSSSVLYLSAAIRREGANIQHFVFALSAGLSMVFATVIAFYFQQKYGNLTFPFFMALVIGYMFKDRMKEAGKNLFAGVLENLLYDRRTIIRTQDGQYRLGFLREKVSFVREKSIPKRIVQARNRDHLTEMDLRGQGEYVICYKKDIVLFTKEFRQAFRNVPEISGINDIIRFDVRPYLQKMAVPVRPRHYLDKGELVSLLCHKVYQLNMIFRYRSVLPRREKIDKRLRLILDRDGIRRVEHIAL